MQRLQLFAEVGHPSNSVIVGSALAQPRDTSQFRFSTRASRVFGIKNISVDCGLRPRARRKEVSRVESFKGEFLYKHADTGLGALG